VVGFIILRLRSLLRPVAASLALAQFSVGVAAQPLSPPSLPGALRLQTAPVGPVPALAEVTALVPPMQEAPPTVSRPVQPLPTEELSPAEAFFAERLGQRLRQFGYDSFRAGLPAAGLVGAPPDGHVLGRGDEVLLVLRGRTRQTHTLRILSDGLLVAPELPPVPAAGRRLQDLRADLEARVAREMPGTEAFLSLGQMRQMTVFVGGEVDRPGMQALPALSTVLDALTAAGGIRRTGSLRAVRVDGPGGSRRVDLYGAISGEGEAPDLLLREGERILVPPLGGVVAVAGEVTRPGIYELPPGTAAAPLSAVLRLAGEPLRPAGNRFLLQGTDGDGRRLFTEIGPRETVRRGDAVLVQPGADVVANRLRLAGHVAAPLARAVPREGARCGRCCRTRACCGRTPIRAWASCCVGRRIAPAGLPPLRPRGAARGTG
jgi:protein involved in polysaccharide export with SLBB domain